MEPRTLPIFAPSIEASHWDEAIELFGPPYLDQPAWMAWVEEIVRTANDQGYVANVVPLTRAHIKAAKAGMSAEPNWADAWRLAADIGYRQLGQTG